MTDNDFLIWQLIQESIGTMLNAGEKEENIIKEILKITHGIANYDDIRREITRQRRMTVN